MPVNMTGQSRIDLNRQASMRDWAGKIAHMQPSDIDGWITWLEGHGQDRVGFFTLAASLRVYLSRKAKADL